MPRKGGRPSIAATTAPRLKALGLFRAEDAKRLGVSAVTLSRWVESGLVVREAPGLYRHPDFKIAPEQLDYAIACKRFGEAAVIGGLSALVHYGLTEQVPSRIWVMVSHKTQSRDPLYRCVRTKTSPRVGVDDRGHYRMTNLERTLVEAFRYATKIGLRVALKATRTALAEKRTTLQKLHKQAKALGLESSLERHWEAIVPESQAA